MQTFHVPYFVSLSFPLLIYFCLWSLNFFLSPSFPFFFPYFSFPFSSLSSPRSMHLSPRFPSFPSSIRLSLLLCPLFSFLPYSLSHTDPSSHLSHPSPFCLSFPSLPFSFSSHVCLPSFLLSIFLWFFPFLIIFLHTSHTYVHLSFLNSPAHISSFPDSWHPSSLWCSFLLAFLWSFLPLNPFLALSLFFFFYLLFSFSHSSPSSSHYLPSCHLTFPSLFLSLTYSCF